VWPGLGKLLEEQGEVSQVSGKLMGNAGKEDHWDGTNLRERLVSELADLSAAIEFFKTENFTAGDLVAFKLQFDVKLARFKTWHKETLEKSQ
jgi:hypothetical protein